MKQTLLVIALALLVTLVACSCSRESSESADVSDTDSYARDDPSGGSDDSEEASDAAQSRGVPPHERRDESQEAEPQIAIRGFDYEWRLAPEKGLHVRIDFVNTRETYARARGYLFIVASSTVSPSAPAGVYPWDTRFDGEYPETHTDGNRLLFRSEMDSRAFIPYKGAEGHFDHLRIIVYHEDGGIAINLDYDLEITGEPTGIIEATPLSVTM